MWLYFEWAVAFGKRAVAVDQRPALPLRASPNPVSDPGLVLNSVDKIAARCPCALPMTRPEQGRGILAPAAARCKTGAAAHCAHCLPQPSDANHPRAHLNLRPYAHGVASRRPQARLPSC